MTPHIHWLCPAELSLTRDLAFAFFRESGLPGNLNFTHWKEQWTKFIDMGIGKIIAFYDGQKFVGMIGGLCVPCTMTAEKEAIEAFWYVQKDHRGTTTGIRLLQAFEKWAKQAGAKRIKMMHLSDLNADMMRNIYLRMGYAPLEQAYWKAL